MLIAKVVAILACGKGGGDGDTDDKLMLIAKSWATKRAISA